MTRRVAAQSHETQQIQDGASYELARLLSMADRPFGTPTTVKTSAYVAQPGEVVLLDPTGGAFTVTLPSSTRSDVGRVVLVVNVANSATTVTIQTETGDVEGGTGITITTGYGHRMLLLTQVDTSGDHWIVL